MQMTDENWARSYAKQALSDLRAREVLVRANAEKCHRLHFLQMAAEKTCKAHLTLANGYDKVKKRHAYVAANLPRIAQQFYALIYDDNQIARWELAAIRDIAREIEVLAPACDHGDVRKDNSEYPWENAKGEICTPCEHAFPNIDDGSRNIIRLIKLIRTAAESFSR